MSLKESLKADLIKSMKAGDKARVGTLRMILSEISYADTSTSKIDHEVAIKRYFNKLKDALSIYTDAERCTALEKEIQVVQEYLPAQPSDTEIKNFVGTLDAAKPFGELMKAVKSQYPSSDGKVVSAIVKSYQGGTHA